MLTKVTCYNPNLENSGTIDPLVLNILDIPDENLFEVRNIDGLGPVKADVNTTPLGSIDGESYAGSNVGKRNIVLTLGLNPNWVDWTVSKLRFHLTKWFMPKMPIRMVFETREFSPVEISGYVESNDPNMFSKDPEQQISIICPYLYFKAVDPISLTGSTTDDPVAIEYEGNVDTGIYVRVSKPFGSTDPNPNYVDFTTREFHNSFIVSTAPPFAPVDLTHDLFLNTIPGDKYIRRIDTSGGATTPDNLLNDSAIQTGWPRLGPSTLDFDVNANSPTTIPDLTWELTYFTLFGSL